MARTLPGIARHCLVRKKVYVGAIASSPGAHRCRSTGFHERVARFRTSRAKPVPRAQAQGIHTDEDVFRKLDEL